MQKYMIWLILCLFTLTGCTTITSKQFTKALEVCEMNGGVNRIKNQGFNLVVTCENGAKFSIKPF